jgi:hypothetical protein
MFKSILKLLDPPFQDETQEKIDKEPVVNKYYLFLGGYFVFFAVVVCALVLMWVTFKKPIKPAVYGEEVTMKDGQMYDAHKTYQLIAIDYPQESMKALQNWVVDALQNIYSFNFYEYDKQKAKAAYFFTPEGYVSFDNALKTSGIEKLVLSKKLEVTILPTKDPAWIKSGKINSDTEFYKMRVPVLISYMGSGKPVEQKQIVDVYLVRVPSYENHKGLAIAQISFSGG